MASIFMAGILPERRPTLTGCLQIASAPAAALPATIARTTRRRWVLAAHFLAQALAIFLRHLLPALAPFLVQAPALLRRQFAPLLAHLLAHLPALLGRHLRLGSRGDRRHSRHRQKHAREVSPDRHCRKFP